MHSICAVRKYFSVNDFLAPEYMLINGANKLIFGY